MVRSSSYIIKGGGNNQIILEISIGSTYRFHPGLATRSSTRISLDETNTMVSLAQHNITIITHQGNLYPTTPSLVPSSVHQPQPYCWWKKSCPLVGSWSHYLQSFIHPRWLAGFLPSTVSLSSCHFLLPVSPGECRRRICFLAAICKNPCFCVDGSAGPVGDYPPETNIAPENNPLEKEVPMGNHHLLGLC